MNRRLSRSKNNRCQWGLITFTKLSCDCLASLLLYVFTCNDYLHLIVLFLFLLDHVDQGINKNPASDLSTFKTKSFLGPFSQLNFLIDDKQHYCICQMSAVDCLCDGKIDIHRLASVSRFQKEQEGAKCEKKIFAIPSLIHRSRLMNC